jgi:hypothetical protein
MIYRVNDFKMAPIFVCELDGKPKLEVEDIKLMLNQHENEMIERFGEYEKG